MSPTPPARRRPPLRRGRASLVLLGAVLTLLAGAAAQPVRAERQADETDWVAFATGARVLDAGSTCIYCPEETARAQVQLLGFQPRSAAFPNPFANPPLVAWILRPAGRLPLRAGLAVMEALSLLALVAAGVAFRRRLGSVPHGTALTVAAVVSLPGAETLALAQWDAVLVAAAIGAVLLAERRRDVAAGLLLSLLLIKPQLVWLVVPVLLATRRWRIAGGFAAGAAAWGFTGVALVGAGGVRQWVGLVTSRHVAETARTVGLPGVVAGITGSGAAGFAAAAVLGAGACALALVLRDRLRADPAEGIALGLCLSVVLAPHVFADDLELLAVPLLVLATRRPGAALGWALALSAAWLADSATPGWPAVAEAAVALGLCVALARSVLARAAGGDLRAPAAPVAVAAAASTA